MSKKEQVVVSHRLITNKIKQIEKQDKEILIRRAEWLAELYKKDRSEETYYWLNDTIMLIKNYVPSVHKACLLYAERFNLDYIYVLDEYKKSLDSNMV